MNFCSSLVFSSWTGQRELTLYKMTKLLTFQNVTIWGQHDEICLNESLESITGKGEKNVDQYSCWFSQCFQKAPISYLCNHRTVWLTLAQSTIFRLFQIERVCHDNFKFYENDRKVSKRIENTVVKGEIAHDEQFLLFPQCFQ